MVRKELGHREWKLSLRGTLFCQRKWTPHRSPVGCVSRLDLLTAVGEGVGWGGAKVVVPLSLLWSFIKIQMSLLETYLPGTPIPEVWPRALGLL